MTDKELRRLSKTELLWLLHDQEEEIQELKERLAKCEAEPVNKAGVEENDGGTEDAVDADT